MRLLNVSSLTFSDFYQPNVPKYAVASHRWHAGAEVFLNDMKKERGKERFGFHKILGFCTFVKNHLSGIEWLWMDTCCINQKSDVEVSEAVNSMFKWYENAAVCLAYLADVTRGVSARDTTEKLGQSEWFQRGWTLQELLAPKLVVFISNEWDVLGHKGGYEEVAKEFLIEPPGPSLIKAISNITEIPEEVLTCYQRSNEYSVESKMRWRKNRKTTRPEDLAYCMLGIFGIRIVLMYGEEQEGADARLLKALRKRRRNITTTGESQQHNLITSGNIKALNSPRRLLTEQKDQTQPNPDSSNRLLRGYSKDCLTTEPKSYLESVADTIPERLPDVPSYEIIEKPKAEGNRYKYFLDGRGLSKHVVKRHLRSILEPQAEMRCTKYQDREGYLIDGPLLKEEQLVKLRQLSREHEMMRRVDKCLIATI